MLKIVVCQKLLMQNLSTSTTLSNAFAFVGIRVNFMQCNQLQDYYSCYEPICCAKLTFPKIRSVCYSFTYIYMNTVSIFYKKGQLSVFYKVLYSKSQLKKRDEREFELGEKRLPRATTFPLCCSYSAGSILWYNQSNM